MTTTEPVNHTALRLARTPGDMAKAVLVLLVPVALLFGLYVFFFGGNNVIAIDPSQTYSDARASSAFTVLAPSGLPSGWKAVSSTYAKGTPSELRVGYVAPDKSGIQLIESDKPADAFVQSTLGDISDVSQSVQAGGRTWGLVKSANSAQHALVNTDASRTVIVIGEASTAELRQFASALK